MWVRTLQDAPYKKSCFKAVVSCLQPEVNYSIKLQSNNEDSHCSHLNTQAAKESKMSSECTLYRDVNFSGAQLTLRREMSELKQQGFNDAASSAKIMGTPWIFYKDTSFMGTSYIVKPGSYPNPSTWGGDNDTLSSLRPLPSETEGDRGVIALFEHTNYGGRMVVLTTSTPDFTKLNFNDRVSSLIVIKGSWTVFRDVNYRVDIGTYTAGAQISTVAPNDTMSSIRLN